MKDYAKELEELKAKHGTVYTLEIPLDDIGENKATIFLKKLDRPTYMAASKLIQKDELQAVEMLVKALRVGGDEASLVINDFDALRSASTSIVPLLYAREGSLKKN